MPSRNEKSCYHCHGQSQTLLGGITVASNIEEMLHGVQTTRNSSLAIGVVGLIVLVSSIYLLFRILVDKPVQEILGQAEKLREEDFTQAVNVVRRDELAHIQDRLNLLSGDLRGIFQDFMVDSKRLADASVHLAEISSKLKTEAGSASEQSNSVAESTREVSAAMQSVASSMEETSTNISLVTTSSDELSKTIDEIAHSSGKTQNVIDSAATTFVEVSGVVSELGDAAREIDAVTDSMSQSAEGVADVNSNIARTAQATEQVSDKVRMVDASTQSILSDSDHLNQRADELSDLSKKIKAAIYRFKV